MAVPGLRPMAPSLGPGELPFVSSFNLFSSLLGFMNSNE